MRGMSWALPWIAKSRRLPAVLEGELLEGFPKCVYALGARALRPPYKSCIVQDRVAG
jgi:hypothetical protein